MSSLSTYGKSPFGACVRFFGRHRSWLLEFARESDRSRVPVGSRFDQGRGRPRTYSSPANRLRCARVSTARNRQGHASSVAASTGSGDAAEAHSPGRSSIPCAG